MKVAVIPNQEKPDAIAAGQQVLEALRARSMEAATLHNPGREELSRFAPDLLVVLGGDGSILAIAQEMVGVRAPVAGINFGKLGYLAAFSLEQFFEHLTLVLAGKAPISERLMLQGTVYRKQKPECVVESLEALETQDAVAGGFALNDIVINAGEPFRMIELEVQINEHPTTTFRSDGVIVATASGSTGYNLSAGGPLVAPDVAAMVLTPICPHSLSFRPVVVSAESAILICPHKLNEGTRINFDGQLSLPLAEENCLLIRKAPVPLRLIENPATSHWQMLAKKLHWARSPRPS